MKLFLAFLFFASSVGAANWRPVEAIVKAQHHKLFPEAALVVGTQKENLFELYPGSAPDRVYDLASLTKVVATATSVMILVDRGQLRLSEPVKMFIPTFAGGPKDIVTVEDLLRHRAGLAAGASVISGETLASFVARVAATPLSYAPRSKYVYSDLSAIFLGYVIEVVSGKSLEEFADENIYRPLGMNLTNFKVSGACAQTTPGRGCVPHDPTAFKLYPESIGNAGLFSSASDLARFARLFLGGGEVDGVRLLSSDAVKAMASGSVRGLGWDLTSEYASAPRGTVFPAGVSFGHTGYTGTTLWIDPKSKTFYLFLSNRVLQGDEATRKPFTAFRRELSTAIGKVIYGVKRR